METDLKCICRVLKLLNSMLPCFQFERLDFGETKVLEAFYNADVAIIDLSIQNQQMAILYHLNVRESFGMKQNMLLFMDNRTATSALKSTLATTYVSHVVIPYYIQVGGSGLPLVTEAPSTIGENARLGIKLKRLLQDVEVQSK